MQSCTWITKKSLICSIYIQLYTTMYIIYVYTYTYITPAIISRPPPRVSCKKLYFKETYKIFEGLGWTPAAYPQIASQLLEGSNAGTPKMNINPGSGTGDVWTSVFFQHYQPKFIEIVHLKTEFHSFYGIGKVLVDFSSPPPPGICRTMDVQHFVSSCPLITIRILN